MKTPMMKCGHAANAKDAKGEPSCVICVCGFNHDDAKTIDPSPPVLDGRVARCPYISCKSQAQSSADLAFFCYKPGQPYDEYYCGCIGWD